jgi:hypothetical protein
MFLGALYPATLVASALLSLCGLVEEYREMRKRRKHCAWWR